MSQDLHLVILNMEAARKEKQWRKLAEIGLNLLLTHDLSDEVQILARAAVSDGFYAVDDAEELRYLDYDGLLERLKNDAEAMSNTADHFWLQGLLQDRRLLHRQRGGRNQILKELTKAIELNSSRSEYYLSRAIAYRRHAQDYTRSLVDCRTAIGLDSSKATYFACRGATYHAAAAQEHPLGDDDKALADYTQAIALQPTWADLYWRRAQIYRAKGDELSAANDEGSACEIDPLFAAWRYAVRARKGAFLKNDVPMLDANRAIALDPESALAYDARAKVWHARERYDLAVKDYQHAIQIEPDRVDWYLSRAHTYYEMGKPDLALADCDQAVSLDPSCAKCYAARAQYLDRQKKYDQAIADFSKAIAIESRSEYIAGRAEVYAKQEQYHQALAEYTQALTLASDDWEIGRLHQERGAIYGKIGSFEDAIHDYSSAIEILPQGWEYFVAEAYFERAVIRLKMGHEREALGDLDRASEIRPSFDYRENASLEFVLQGIACEENGKFEDAIANYTCAIAARSKDATPYVRRGEIYFDQKDYERAYEDFAVANDLEPGSVEHQRYYWTEQAHKHFDKKDFVSARDYCTKAIAVGDDPYVLRAFCHRQLGDHENAIVDYTKEIELRPESSLSYRWRGKSYFEIGNYGSAVADFTVSIARNSTKWELRDLYESRSRCYDALGDTVRAEADRRKLKDLE